jgi:hypothetical protein
VWILSISGLLFGALCILGITAREYQSETRKLLCFWLIVPILGALGISALIPSLAYNARYAAAGFPAYIFILALGMARLRRPFMQIALCAAVLAINGLSLANYYHNPQYSREDARSAARYLEAEAQSGDIIAIVGNDTALRYYYHGTVPLVRWRNTTVPAAGTLSGPLHEFRKDYEQLWLIAIRPWERDPQGKVKRLVDEQQQLLEHTAFPGVDIYKYRLRPHAAH